MLQQDVPAACDRVGQLGVSPGLGNAPTAPKTGAAKKIAKPEGRHRFGPCSSTVAEPAPFSLVVALFGGGRSLRRSACNSPVITCGSARKEALLPEARCKGPASCEC